MANTANLYADEQFPRPVVEFLRDFGHNVLTTQEAGQANQGIPDEEVLVYAIMVESRNRVSFQYLWFFTERCRRNPVSLRFSTTTSLKS